MATLNLNGTNITLPDGTVFTTSYLTGSNNVTNNNAGKSGNATLTEGGGGAGNTYSGTISDGTAGTTAITQTSGFVEFTGTNTYSGGTNLEGGTIAVGENTVLCGICTLMVGGGDLQVESRNLLPAIVLHVDLAGDRGGSFGVTVNLRALVCLESPSAPTPGAPIPTRERRTSTRWPGTIEVHITSDASIGSGSLIIDGDGVVPRTPTARNKVILTNSVSIRRVGNSCVHNRRGSATIAGEIDGVGGSALMLQGGTIHAFRHQHLSSWDEPSIWHGRRHQQQRARLGHVGHGDQHDAGSGRLNADARERSDAHRLRAL